MRALIYFIVWTCVTVSLFITFAYLLTVVDPGLKEVPAKAARMMRNELQPVEPTILNVYRLKTAEELRNPLDSLVPFYRFASAVLTTISSENDYNDKAIYILPFAIIKDRVPDTTPSPSFPTTEKTDNATKVPETKKGIHELNFTQVTSSVNYSLSNSLPPLTLSSTPQVTTLSSVKGFRRSINSFQNKIIDGNSGSVIMEILDKNGRPRIEIKLNTDDFPEIDKNVMRMGSKLIMKLQNNDEKDVGGLEYYTKIKILPNDTVVIDSSNKLLEKRVNDTRTNIILAKKANQPHGTIDKTKAIDDVKINKTTKLDIFNNTLKPTLEVKTNKLENVSDIVKVFLSDVTHSMKSKTTRMENGTFKVKSSTQNTSDVNNTIKPSFHDKKMYATTTEGTNEQYGQNKNNSAMKNNYTNDGKRKLNEKVNMSDSLEMKTFPVVINTSSQSNETKSLRNASKSNNTQLKHNKYTNYVNYTKNVNLVRMDNTGNISDTFQKVLFLGAKNRSKHNLEIDKSFDNIAKEHLWKNAPKSIPNTDMKSAGLEVMKNLTKDLQKVVFLVTKNKTQHDDNKNISSNSKKI